MNFKKFNGTTWETVQHKIYGSGTDSLTAFPAVIQASGEPLTDYLISGNTLQSGTPTPDAPVDVVGCGEWDATEQQYKIPVVCGGVTSNIYLGNVQTTRRIKKLVLTGGGVFAKNSPLSTNYLYYAERKVILPGSVSKTPLFCNEMPVKTEPPISVTGINTNNDFGTVYFNFGADVMDAQPSGNTVAGLKEYLAAQYAAGTPVTIWYVLAKPETGIVNEPIHKIGDYSDTISFAQAGVTIPTSDGDNAISFGTTVHPSGMSATFRGWHPVQSAKVYDGNDWS